MPRSKKPKAKKLSSAKRRAEETRHIIDVISDFDSEMLFADGFEEALIGYVEIFSKTIALYDRDRCIEILKKRDGMDHEGAEEYFCFNVTGAYVGETTPAFATILRKPAKA